MYCHAYLFLIPYHYLFIYTYTKPITHIQMKLRRNNILQSDAVTIEEQGQKKRSQMLTPADIVAIKNAASTLIINHLLFNFKHFPALPIWFPCQPSRLTFYANADDMSFISLSFINIRMLLM